MEHEELRLTIRHIITEGFSEMFEKAVTKAKVKQEEHYQSSQEKALEETPEPQGVDKILARLRKKLK